jgi:hypothetical protein
LGRGRAATRDVMDEFMRVEEMRKAGAFGKDSQC